MILCMLNFNYLMKFIIFLKKKVDKFAHEIFTLSFFLYFKCKFIFRWKKSYKLYWNFSYTFTLTFYVFFFYLNKVFNLISSNHIPWQWFQSVRNLVTTFLFLTLCILSFILNPNQFMYKIKHMFKNKTHYIF